MTTSVPPVRRAPAGADPLAPVRDALLDRARHEAHRLLAAADADVDRALAAARDDAAETLAVARAAGAADAATALADARARARRQARARVLAARRTAYEDLRRQAREATRALCGGPDAAAVLDVLRERAGAALGPGAVVTDAPGGGVRAESAGRRVTLTPEALADEALDRLGAEVEGLWAP